MEKQTGTGRWFIGAAIVLFISALILTPAGLARMPAQPATDPCARTWHLAPTTTALASDFNYLTGVAAIAQDDVWAVGSRADSRKNGRLPLAKAGARRAIRIRRVDAG